MNKGGGAFWLVCLLDHTNHFFTWFLEGKFPCQTFTRRRVVKLVERPVPNVETQGSGVRFLQGVT